MVNNHVISDSEIINQINPTKRKYQAKMTKYKNRDFLFNSKNMEARSGFFISKARLVFTQLRQTFIEALILYNFNPKCHIRIKIDVSRYPIDEMQVG